MKHELIEFENGTCSLRSPVTGEPMHSKMGAWEEARHLYVIGSGFVDRLEEARRSGQEQFVVYDLGLGIAANAVALIEAYREWSAGVRTFPQLKIISFENDCDGLKSALNNDCVLKRFPFLVSSRVFLEKLLEEKYLNHIFELPFLTWTLFEGDFQIINKSPTWGHLPKADLICFDFYSPDTDVGLWQQDVFVSLSKKLSKDGLLVTYAFRKSVIKNLLVAGFSVAMGPGTPVKRVTTHAFLVQGLEQGLLKNTDRLLRYEWLDRLRQSPCKPTAQEWEILESHPQWSILA